ncbi:Hint domain-containing protein [Asaia bogorensis]|uniref:Hint domain-containing protein n=1 Tax=Asaia bogorensis TaxID=91915 RepID=UPI0013CF00DF|nr:Hint domain-containing protein [Asaia bogorensis]
MATILSGWWSAVNVSGQTMYQSGTTYVGQPASFAANTSITVMSGATVTSLSGSSLAITVQTGGAVTSANLDGGTLSVASGGVLTRNNLSGVSTTLSSGAQSINDTYVKGSTGVTWSYALNGATVSGATVGSGGYLQLQTGAVGTNISAVNGGSASLAAGTTTGIQALNGGYIQSGVMTFSGYLGNGDVVSTGAVLNGVWSAVNVNGKTVYQNGTTTVSDPVILNGATLYVGSGAVVSGLTCISGTIPTISVYAGGSITDSHITRTYVRVDSGATLSNNRLDGCDVTLSTGARSTDDTYSWYGFAVQSVKVASGAVVTHANVTSNTTISAATGATINGLHVASGGSAVFGSGVNLSGYNADPGTYLATYTSIGGTVTVPATPASPTGTVLNGTWSAVNSGGTTVYTNGLSSVQAPATLGNGAILWVTSGAVATGLSGYGNYIYVQNGGTLASSYIANGAVYVSSGGTTKSNKFNSDPVTIYSGGSSVNDTFYNSGYDNNIALIQAGGSLISGQVASGGTMSAMSGSVVRDPSVGNGAYLVVDKAVTEICFLKGTHILTARGEVRVEELEVGEPVACKVEGEIVFRPIIWIGQRFNRLEPWQPADLAGYPVRIEENAFEPGVPSRDLLVTPEHCFAFDGKMLPIRMLVNGTTIRYDLSMQSYEYYHIELSEHSIILAENTPAESYIDTGNRHLFNATHNVVSLGAPPVQPYALPLCVERDFAQALYERFAQGVAAQDTANLTSEPDLRLVDGAGCDIRPVRRDGSRYVFRLPPGTAGVHIASRAARPCDSIGPYVDDRRRLGVLVGAIDGFSCEGQFVVTAHLTGEWLPGWHSEEGGVRWTDGYGWLPLASHESMSPIILSIEVIDTATYLNEPSEAQQIALTA